VTATPSDRFASPTEILIIGGGASGTLVATQILRRATTQSGAAPVAITIVERDATPFRGRAYSTTSPHHLLNVAASKMTAFPEDPSHFMEWLRARGEPYHEGSYVPRMIYGEYLEAQLHTALESAPPHVTFRVIYGEVARVVEQEIRTEVTLKDGTVLTANKVVLASGNFEPSPPTGGKEPFYTSARYFNDPWKAGALEQVGIDDTVLLVGTGLTMVDLVLTLNARGHRGKIVALSRRGLMPRAHAPELLPTHPRYPLTLPYTVRGLSRMIREEIRRGTDWRLAIDALRPDTIPVWMNLDERERRRFLRHLKSHWDVHRHRIAHEVFTTLTNVMECGQLSIIAGRILGFSPHEEGVTVTIRPRRSAASIKLSTSWVINCTGPDLHISGLKEPLIKRLVEDGYLRAAPLGMGFDATPDGALINREGVPSTRFFTLGPPLKGVLWETIAIPEIRVQAQQLAARLLAQ
jgi:uncharacterized NAD(P)/FAD-binding protein YdhS